MRKKIIMIVALAVVFAFGAKVTQALPLIPIQPLHIDPAVIKAFHDARCAKFKGKIEEKSSNIKDRQEKHESAYDNLASRLENLISRLNANGYDTTQLGADLSTFKDKINTFKEDYDTLSEKTDAAKGSVCDDSDNTIKGNLGDIRTEVQTLKKDAKDIRNFYKDEIRDDIRSLKK
jgi:DNA repair exonuclease SbcCD ATPase subunit